MASRQRPGRRDRSDAVSKARYAGGTGPPASCHRPARPGWSYQDSGRSRGHGHGDPVRAGRTPERAGRSVYRRCCGRLERAAYRRRPCQARWPARPALTHPTPGRRRFPVAAGRSRCPAHPTWVRAATGSWTASTATYGRSRFARHRWGRVPARSDGAAWALTTRLRRPLRTPPQRLPTAAPARSPTGETRRSVRPPCRDSPRLPVVAPTAADVPAVRLPSPCPRHSAAPVPRGPATPGHSATAPRSPRGSGRRTPRRPTDRRCGPQTAARTAQTTGPGRRWDPRPAAPTVPVGRSRVASAATPTPESRHARRHWTVAVSRHALAARTRCAPQVAERPSVAR